MIQVRCCLPITKGNQALKSGIGCHHLTCLNTSKRSASKSCRLGRIKTSRHHFRKVTTRDPRTCSRASSVSVAQPKAAMASSLRLNKLVSVRKKSWDFVPIRPVLFLRGTVSACNCGSTLHISSPAFTLLPGLVHAGQGSDSEA